VDESGDHGLANIDPKSPYFVLAFCIFRKSEYTNTITPKTQNIKFKYWGHDNIVLHGHEIRKSKNAFNILLNAGIREQFMIDLTRLVADTDFTLIASAIDKNKLTEKYEEPNNPYHIALAHCMERLYVYMNTNKQTEMHTHICVEQRGKKEDAELEEEFTQICAGSNELGITMPNFGLRMVNKKHNSTGLQFADLVSQPIGRHVISPDQSNRAFSAIKSKFQKRPDGDIDGWGLKIFP